MRIVFICGGLEPGRDGIGDYTHQLATELIKKGHTVSAIALNDKYVKILKKEERLTNHDFIVLRLPSNWKSAQRYKYAKDWIDSFDPEWLSLQFGPYSFNKKGLPFNLGVNLKNIGKLRKWHVMFHELWIGRDRNTAWSKIFVPVLQEKLIKKMVDNLSPKVIHTHLPVFFSRLKKFGWDIKKLPLFSNIEIYKKITEKNNPNIFRVGFFSQIEASESIISFLNILAQKALLENFEFEILLIGGNETRMKTIGKVIETSLILKNSVKYLGFLENEEISHALQDCTIGITPLPRHALGKSGSVAAFITHGIPVAAPNFHYNPTEIGFLFDELSNAIITEPDFDQIEIAKSAANLASDKIVVFRIADTLLSDIKKFEVN